MPLYAITINRSLYTYREAADWITDHNYTAISETISPDTYRFDIAPYKPGKKYYSRNVEPGVTFLYWI